jgi:hypothetical protein
MKIEFFQDIFSKNSQAQDFRKDLPVGAKLLRVDGETDRRTDGQTDRLDEASSHFPQFCEGT